MTRIIAIIPAYNEKISIGRIVRARQHADRVIVIEGGSSDIADGASVATLTITTSSKITADAQGNFEYISFIGSSTRYIYIE